MKFHEVAVGDKFKFNNQEYVKVPEIRVSCCKISCNAEIVGTAEKAVLKPLDEVEKINQ